MIDSICTELVLQKEFLDNEKIKTIYFGGGTPSILNPEEIDQILNTIHRHYPVETDIELTLEANPDDLDKTKIAALKESGINRLSIGIQSFFDSDLEWMNRSHNSAQSHEVIQNALYAGISNLNIDLIFGCPTTSTEMWKKNLSLTLDYNIKHLSCYALTVEEKTALGYFVKTGKTPSPDDKLIQDQYDLTTKILAQHGFIHYEISNYALDNQFAVHNTSYWKGEKYLGVGPSSHSFNGSSRFWNISHNKKYIDSISMNRIPSEMEILSESDRFNEYLMTGFRTMWGCAEEQLDEVIRDNNSIRTQLDKHLEAGNIVLNEGYYKLTEEAWLTSDSIISDLFID